MRKKPYGRLREEHRQVIYRMSKAGKAQAEIADAIGFDQSTVSRELRRNRGDRGYRPKQAHGLARGREAAKRKRPRAVRWYVESEVHRRLALKHSPEQISGALALEGWAVSTESIYRYIQADKKEGGDLYKHLRINGKRRYRRRVKAGREKIPDRIGIEHRPPSVAARLHYGHWEADLIEGAKGSGFVLSVFERKSRTGLLHKLPDKRAQGVSESLVKLLCGYKVRSITYDNGLEFARHQAVSAALGARAYFCAPYHSWEKGAVENYNGLVRQFVPKGSALSDYTEADMARIEQLINDRPRKILAYRTPNSLNEKITIPEVDGLLTSGPGLRREKDHHSRPGPAMNNPPRTDSQPSQETNNHKFNL